jgi:hypothetical protein
VTVTFTNQTNADSAWSLKATVGGADSAQFLVTDDGCTGTSLFGGDTCTVTLLFKPTSTGVKTATLDLSNGCTAALVLNATAVP